MASIKDKWSKVHTKATGSCAWDGGTTASEDDEIRNRWQNNNNTASYSSTTVMQGDLARAAAISRLQNQKRSQHATTNQNSPTFDMGLRAGAVERAVRGETVQLPGNVKDLGELPAFSKLEDVRNGSNEDKYSAVNRYFAENPTAQKLWKLERGLNTNQNATAARRKEAEAIRAGMSADELRAYNDATALYDSYGKGYSAGKRVKDVVAGSLKGAKDSVGVFLDALVQSGDNVDDDLKAWGDREAWRMQARKRMLTDPEGAQQMLQNEPEWDTSAVMTEEGSPALKRNREDQAQVQRGLEGMSGVGAKAGELANSMITNAPGMVLGLLPGGQALSLSVLGAQATGGRVDELSAQGVGVDTALNRGVVSGGIEVGTEVVPIGEIVPEQISKWVKQPVKNWIRIVQEGGESAAENIAKQALGEATEEGTSYVLNYLADLAYQDPNAEFSLAELADNMAMGAASGGVYGAVGTGINRALGGSANMQEDPVYRSTPDGVVNEGTAASAQAETTAPAAEAPTAPVNAARQAADQAFVRDLLQQVQDETAPEGQRAAQNAGEQNLLREIAAQRQMVDGGMTADEAETAYRQQAQQLARQAQEEARQRMAEQETARQAAQEAPQAAVQQENTANTAQSRMQEVQRIAAEAPNYNDAMRQAFTANYQGGSVDAYTQAMDGMYNAGRTGAMTYEQAVDAVGAAGAVVNDQQALQAAYQAGAEGVAAPVDPAGAGAVQGSVSYENGMTLENSHVPADVLGLTAQKLGVDIKVVQSLTDGDGNAVNGHWAAGMSQIALGDNSGNGYQTLMHELTHYMGSYNAEGWARTREAVLSFYANNAGMTAAQEHVFEQYEGAYGNSAVGADEAARDILSGIMSTEDGVQQFCKYLTEADSYTTAEKKSILQTMRDMIAKIVEKLRAMIHGGDATQGAAEGRKLAERADAMYEATSIIDDFIAELDVAKKNAKETSRGENVQVEQNEGEKKYSYAGVNAEQADTNALEHAQQMEADDADAEDIRRETGWFRGVDGKWRFEIDDSKVTWNRRGDNSAKNSNADYALYQKLTNDFLYGTIDSEGLQKLTELDKVYKNYSTGNKVGDYLDAPELYKQYPQLKDVSLTFKEMGNVLGQRTANGLVLNEKYKNANMSEQAKATLLHEIQHWIQNKENFAAGASPEYWQNQLDNGERIETKQYKNDLGTTWELGDKYDELGIDIKPYAEKYLAGWTDEEIMRACEDAEKHGIDADDLSRYAAALWGLRNDAPASTAPVDLYRNTAGEIEARDVEARRNYTEEQRRNTKPNIGDENTVFARKYARELSIDMDADGKPFVEVDENLLDGVEQKAWAKTVMDTLKKRFPDGFMRDGWRIELTREGRKEFTSSRDTQVMAWARPQMYADKMRMAANLDEIVSVANEIRNEMPKHARTDGILSFNRSGVQVRVGNTDYTADVVTGIKPGSREIFYNITNLQETQIKKAPTEMQSAKKSSLATDVGEGASYKNNIAQTENNVNTKPAAQMSQEEAYAESERLKEETASLREQRKSWENSTAVEEIRTERDALRKKYGMFSTQLKEWEANTQAWQDYVQQRDAFKKQALELNDRRDAVDDVLRSMEADKENTAWQEKLTQQKAYDAQVADSGLSAADYRRQAAVKAYGTTNSFEAAGYLMPDGKMLDFSDGAADGKRGLDHRNIQDVYGPAELGRNATQTDYLNSFVTDGNVRIMAEGPGVDISADVKPTAAQLEKIAEMADTLGVQNKRFTVDLRTADGKQAATRQYEGRVRGDEIVNDIKAFYQDGTLPERSELNQFRYSKDGTTDSATTLQERLTETQRQNRELARKVTKAQEQADYWRQETQLTGGHQVDPKALRQAATDFLSRYESNYDRATFTEELQRAFATIKKDGSNTAEALETLTSLARSALRESVRVDTTARDYYAPVREWLRSTPILVQEGSPEYADLLAAFGDGDNGKRSWGNVRKNTFGRLDLKLVPNGQSGNVDTVVQEMSGNWPNIFDESAAPSDNVQRALDVFGASAIEYHDVYGSDLDQASAQAGQELMDAYLTMPAKQTRADKQLAKLQETRRTLQAEKKAALAAQKQAYDARVKELEAGQSARKAQLRAKYLEATRKAANANNTEVAARLTKQAEGYKAQLAELNSYDNKALNKKLIDQKARYEILNQRRNDTILQTRARDSVQKSVQQLYRWLSKPNDAGRVQTRMEKAVYDLLTQIDPNTSHDNTKTAARWQETMKDIRSMAQEALAADRGEADVADYADFDPDLPNSIKELLDDAGSMSLRDMNGRQTQMLADILTSMKTSIQNANKMLSDGRAAEVEEVAAKSIREMEGVKASQLKTRNELVGKMADSRTYDMVSQLLGLDMMDSRRFFSSLGGTVEQEVYKPIRDGFDKRVWKLEAAQEQFAKIKGDTDISKWTGSKAEKHTFKLGNGTTIELTVGQMMELYNLSQRPQAKDHLMQGGISIMQDGKRSGRVKIDPTDLANITGALTNEQVRMARAMAGYLSAADGPAGWGNEVTQHLYGLDKFREGYYWPIKTDSNYTRTSDANATDTAGLYAIKNQGFTKALQRKANNPLLINDAFDTWCDHVANMATYNAWAIPLSDAMKWYNYKVQDANTTLSTKEALEGVYGAKGKKYFQTLMQDINGVSAGAAQTGYARLTKSMIRNWKVAKVGANLRVAIQQPTAYMRAAAVIDPKYLAGALAYDVGRLQQGMDRAESNCGIAKWKSWGYFETNIGQTMKSVLTGETDTMDKVREVSTSLAELGDRVTWGTLWNACELEAKDKGMKAGSQESIDYCAQRLSEIVDKTQVVDSVLHRSQIMRSKDMLAQMATNFFAEPTKTYSMMAEAAVKLAHNEKGAKEYMGRVTATYLATAFATSAASSLIDAWRVSDDDKDKDFGERYLSALWDGFVDNINMINNIPFFKDVKSIFDGYDATRTDMEAATDLYNALSAWQKLLSGNGGKTTPYKLLYKTANAFADISGIPTGTAVREMKSAYDLLTGMQDPLHVDEAIANSNAKMNSRIARGKMDEAQDLLDDLAQTKVDGGKTEKEAKSTMRSSLTSYWKPLYVAADDAGRAEIAAKLLALKCFGEVIYTQKDLDKWVKDSSK